jgi:hypothetical protein
MKTNPAQPIDLTELTARIRAWQQQHNTPEKVAAAHRKVLLERVVQSMAFESEPVSMERLMARLEARKKKGAEDSEGRP